MTEDLPRVGVVVLTYNSTKDLPECLMGLIAQRGVDLRTIVVDNASYPCERTRMEADFLAAMPEGRVIAATEAHPEAVASLPAVFLRNAVNGGYSAGNNVGARLAVGLGCEAVLIVNPDVRIEDPDYVAGLAAVLAASPNAGLAASAVRSLSGANENPMHEPGPVKELLWPVDMLLAGLRRGRAPRLPLEPSARIEKVSGSCFLISTEVLEKIGYFDEGAFLYCEESILAAQLKDLGLTVAYTGALEVLHAHDTCVKGDPYRRYATWSRSRAYYHRTYTRYGPVLRAMLSGSRRLILELIRGREALRRSRDRSPILKKGNWRHGGSS